MVVSGFAFGVFANAQCVPSWSGVPTLNNVANSSLVLADGRLVIGGAFTNVGGATARGLAVRSGAVFTELAGGVGAHVAPSVRAIAQLPGGDLLIGGTFGTAGGVAIRHVARLDLATNTFSQLGAGLTVGSASVEAIHVLTNGQAVIGGQFGGVSGGVNVLLFDRVANTLTPIGGPTAGPLGIVNALTSSIVAGQTRLFAGGNFNQTLWSGGSLATQNIACFNFGTGTWLRCGPGSHPAGDGVNGPVLGLFTFNNRVVVGGSFTAAFGAFPGPGTPAANVAEFLPAASVWSPLGAGLSHSGLGVQPSVSSFAVHPFFGSAPGGLVAGGQFNNSGGTTTNLVARFDGSGWQPIDSGLTGGAIATVDTITVLPNSDLLLGGAFTAAGTTPVTNIATRVVCPALAAAYGSGCASSVGTLTLSPNSLPLIGGNFLATCINLPTSSLVISGLGFSATSFPLSASGLPSSPTCLVLSSSESSVLLSPTGNSVQTSLPIPLTPGLMGLNLFHQVIGLETDLAGNIIDATSSNGLAITIGGI